jgi:hypothetical protein
MRTNETLLASFQLLLCRSGFYSTLAVDETRIRLQLIRELQRFDAETVLGLEG